MRCTLSADRVSQSFKRRSLERARLCCADERTQRGNNEHVIEVFDKMHCLLSDIADALRQDLKGQDGAVRPAFVTHSTEELPFLSSLEVDGVGVLPLPLTRSFAQRVLPGAQLSVACTLALDAQQAVTVSLSCVWRAKAGTFRFLHPAWNARIQDVARHCKQELHLPKVRKPRPDLASARMHCTSPPWTSADTCIMPNTCNWTASALPVAPIRCNTDLLHETGVNDTVIMYAECPSAGHAARAHHPAAASFDDKRRQGCTQPDHAERRQLCASGAAAAI